MRVKGRLDVTTNQFIFTDLSPEKMGSENREVGTNYDFRLFQVSYIKKKFVH